MNKVLFIHPFQFVKKNLSNEILMWFVYLDNWLKAKINNIITDVIYLPAETEIILDLEKSLTLKEINNLNSVLDTAISNLEFELDDKTYIALSCPTSFDFQAIKLISNYFREYFPTSTQILGGYHASSCKGKEVDVDYVNIGEGELNLFFIINNNYRKQKSPIILKNNPINDLNALPPLNLSILDKYIDSLKSKARGLSISLSRNCPWNCHFCIEKNLRVKNISKWRAYSPTRAVNEVNTMVEYGLEHDIYLYGFLDPCFGFKKDWLMHFLKLYNVNEQVINHFLETRLDFLSPNILHKPKKKKMFLFYGIESFHKEMLVNMNKTLTPARYLNHFSKILKIHKNLGYNYTIGILCNHPGETSESYRETFENLEKISENSEANVSPTFFHLFPNTFIYENFSFLKNKYGTEAYIKEWWQNMDTLKLGAFAVKPSRSLSLRDSIETFFENCATLDKIKHRNKNSEDFSALLRKRFELKEQKDELLKFLDRKNIELAPAKKSQIPFQIHRLK